MFALSFFPIKISEKWSSFRNTPLTSAPVPLKKLEDKFQIRHPNFLFYKLRRRHDLFSHILGGGMTTPRGEVFGELIEYVLSTVQKEAFSPKTKEKPSLTLPTKSDFLEKVDFLEKGYTAMGDMDSNDYLSKNEIEHLFNYATTLLGEYVQRWGVRKGEGLFGAKGYKDGSLNMRKYVKNTL